MIINEQKHSNHCRIYYHGYIKGFDPGLKECPEFYLTTSFAYASSYAGSEGIVSEFYLKKDCNIFNAFSKRDFELVKEYCEKYARQYLNKLSYLKTRDWWDLFDQNIEKRRSFLDILEDLGFDGYFNYEADKELQKKYEQNSQIVMPGLTDSASIGMFDDCNLIKGRTFYGKKDFLKNEEVQKVRELQLTYLAYKMLELYDQKRFTPENIRNLYYQFDGVLFFDLKELTELTKSWDLDYLLKHKEEFVKKFSFLKEDLIIMMRPFVTIKKKAIRLAEKLMHQNLLGYLYGNN